MKKAIGIIPARWESTRFPGKPLHVIAGEPLLKRVWQQVRRAKALDTVIVATDDMRIAEAAFAWGAEVSLTSAKHQSGTDRVAEVVQKIDDAKYVVNIQGDEPLVDPRLIDRIVQALRTTEVAMVTAAHPFSKPAEAQSPHQVKVVIDAESNALYFSRAAIPFLRGASPSYLRHQGIYGYRRGALLRFVKWKPTPLERAESLEQLRALEHGVRIHVLVTKTGSAGIDTPEDAAALEQIITRARGQRTRR